MNLRRRCLIAAAAGWTGFARAAGSVDSREAARSSHFPFGPVVPPRRVESWPMVTNHGKATDLPALLRGRVSAAQLMFTGCSATCPLQGALFSQAQGLLRGGLAAAQFVSISVDPLGDTPAALDEWLRKFGARPGWIAVLPRAADMAAILNRLGEGGENPLSGPDSHAGQVYLFDRRAELVLRTPSLPPAEQIVAALRSVDARG